LKSAAYIERPKPKSVSASPPDHLFRGPPFQGLCPWTVLGAVWGHLPWSAWKLWMVWTAFKNQNSKPTLFFTHSYQLNTPDIVGYVKAYSPRLFVKQTLLCPSVYIIDLLYYSRHRPQKAFESGGQV